MSLSELADNYEARRWPVPGVGAGRTPSLCLRAYGERRLRTPEREAGKEAKSGRGGMRTEKGRGREHPNQGKAHGLAKC